MLDDKEYERISVEKDGNRQINSAAINTRKLQHVGHHIRYDTSHYS